MTPTAARRIREGIAAARLAAGHPLIRTADLRSTHPLTAQAYVRTLRRIAER